MSQSRKRKKIKRELLEEFESMTGAVPVTQLFKKVKSEPGQDENVDTSGLLNLKSNQDQIKIKKEPEDVVTLSSDCSSDSSSGSDSESDEKSDVDEQLQVKQEPSRSVKQELMNDGDHEIRTLVVESVNELEPEAEVNDNTKNLFLTHLRPQAEMMKEAEDEKLTQLYVKERIEENFMIKFLEKMIPHLTYVQFYRHGICTCATLEKLSTAPKLHSFILHNRLSDEAMPAMWSFLDIKSSTLETFKTRFTYDHHMVKYKWPMIKTLTTRNLKYDHGTLGILDMDFFRALDNFPGTNTCCVKLPNGKLRESWFTYLKNHSTSNPDFKFNIECVINDKLVISNQSNVPYDTSQVTLHLKCKDSSVFSYDLSNIKNLIVQTDYDSSYMIRLLHKLPQLESISFIGRSRASTVIINRLSEFQKLNKVKLSVEIGNPRLTAIKNLVTSKAKHLLEFKLVIKSRKKKDKKKDLPDLFTRKFENMIDFNIPGIRFVNNVLKICNQPIIEIIDKFPNVEVCNIVLKEDSDDIAWLTYFRKFSKDHPDRKIVFTLNYQDKTTMKIEFTGNELNKYLL